MGWAVSEPFFYGVECSAIAGMQVGTIAAKIKYLDNQSIELINVIDSTIVSTIAGAIAGAIAESERKVMVKALEPQVREYLLTRIGVTNQRKNYDKFMHPLVTKGWLTKTIPDKPTSPNQKYLTTLKGRLVLEILKRHD